MVKIIAKKKQWQWYQRQKLSLGFIGRTERLQNYGRPFEGNRKEHPVFSPGRRRKKVSGIKTFTTRIGFKVATHLTLKNLHGCRIFFPYSDIFDAMSLVKHGAGETVIQQGTT